jgi:GNAT superfamily N-acetyltransferase
MADAIRPAAAADEAFLWECLAWAAYEDGAAAARQVPYLVKWLEGWPRPTDFGAVAEADGRPAGGAWARLFDGPDPELPIYVDYRTPEIAIGVRPDMRGAGIGERLLDALIEDAQRRALAGLCLTVRAENPAIGLYRRKGFAIEPAAERINRVGGVSYGMVLRLRG